MKGDVIERLKDWSTCGWNEVIQLRKDAADRIEALEDENARMREALDKALERLEASFFKNAEHAQAAEIIFAALQDKGET